MTQRPDAMRPVALLTGTGRSASIAHGIARTLADRGFDLALSTWTAYDRAVDYGGEPDDVDALIDELRAAGSRVVRLEADLADPETPARITRATVDEFGRLDALVLSHSQSVDSSILNNTVDAFDRHFAVNARAAWLLIKAFAEIDPGRTAGRIVALTSDHVVHNLAYGSSKGALDRIVVAAAGELGHLGITANLVNPGPIDTGWMDDDVRATLRARQPTGRLGAPSDTAQLVAFLVSPESAWVTGQLIKSDGGFSL